MLLDVMGELNGPLAVVDKVVVALISPDGRACLRAHNAVDRAGVVDQPGELL